MSRKIAVKRLTASDLTFFQWHFRNQNAGNQKAINLNADVFIDVLYPNLPNLITAQDGRIPLDLFIYGPNAKGELNLQRKIVKQPSYKNYRLNGEFVFNPEDDLERFNPLVATDIAVIEFVGEVTPGSAKLILLSQNEAEDIALFRQFDIFLGNHKMLAIDPIELTALIESAGPACNHPINELTLVADLEDAARGGERGIRRLMGRPSGRRVSRSELYRARENADRIGDLGEAFVDAYLTAQRNNGEIREYIHESANNAIAPYDFEFHQSNGERVLMDAKSTEGEFDRILHVSVNELRQMASSEARYDIYRIFEMTATQAKLRIARNMRDFATGVLAIMEQLPNGVTTDGISIRPSVLPFEAEVYLINMIEEQVISEE